MPVDALMTAMSGLRFQTKGLQKVVQGMDGNK